MAAPSQQLAVIESTSRTTYVLQRPPRIRALGLWGLGSGAIAIGVCVWQVGPAVQRVLQHSGSWMNIAPTVVVGAMWLALGIVGIALVGLGVWTLLGSRSIILEAGRLRAVRRIGPIVWWSTRATPLVDRLLILDKHRLETGDREPAPKWFTERFGGVHNLYADASGDAPMLLARWRDPKWHDALANDIATRIRTHTGDHRPIVRTLTGWIGRDELVEGATVEHLLTLRPLDSRVRAERTEDGWNFTVPPPRGRERGHGLVQAGATALFFCAGFIVFLAWLLAGTGHWSAWLIGAFFGVILLMIALVGLHFIGAGLGFARKRAVIDVVGGALLYTEKAVAKVVQHEWTEIASLTAAESATNVDHQIFYEIRVTPQSGEVVNLLPGRSEAEIFWLAAILRAALGIKG
ncbi:MAG: hypothetical protein AAFX05_05500 [Planctomycetota bacterium]